MLDANIPAIVIIAVTMKVRPIPVTNPIESAGESVVYPPEIIPDATWYGMTVVMMYATRPMLNTLPVLKTVALTAEATPSLRRDRSHNRTDVR